MKKTRLCDLLGIEYPIIQGGMTLISNPELAAAVSNAGGLGIIVTNSGGVETPTPEYLRKLIRKTKELTSKPFGVNLPIAMPGILEFAKVVAEEGVPVVTTSAGSPQVLTPALKAAGVKVLHVVASVRHAVKAQEVGVDGVIAEGYEAGGHNGPEELPTMVLVPQVVDAVQVPVVAAGGIADARGFIAALALGADGVQMGTRFIATHECIAHPNVKEAIIHAADTGTLITGRRLGPARIIRNPFALALAEKEYHGASPQELIEFIGAGRTQRGQIAGDLTEGEAYCGAVAGLIREITSAGDVVRSIISGAEVVLGRLN